MTMSKQTISIFDISLLMDSICCELHTCDIVNCRRVCKAWNAAFAAYEWRHVHLNRRLPEFEYVYSHMKRTRSPYDPLSAMDIKLIRDRSQWISALEISLFDTLLKGSLCTTLQRLACFHDRDEPMNSSVEDSSLALLCKNRGLKELELDFYDSHVRRYVVPNLPRLTHLQSLRLALDRELLGDVALFLDVLQSIPPSLQVLDLQVVSDNAWHGFSDISTHPLRTWEPSAIRDFTFRASIGHCEPYFLLPFLRSCPQLERLFLPASSSNYVEEVMRTLAASFPQLSSLTIDPRQGRPFGTECAYFAQMRYKFSVLSLDIHSDIKNVVVSTLLAHSAGTLQELRLKFPSRLPSLDAVMILRTCPELRVLHVDTSFDPRGRSLASITLQDLVEVPWACTRLKELKLVVTDMGTLDLLLPKDYVEKLWASLVLRLHRQFQDLKDFSPFAALSFWRQNFTKVPENILARNRGWQMTEDDLLRLRPLWIVRAC